jgi:hypothetical protein
MNKLFLSFILLLPLLLLGQSKKIKSFKVEGDVDFITVDRAGDFYIVFQSGDIQKLDKNGEPIAKFKTGAPLTSFDPTNAIRLLAYQRQEKRFTWLSPSLENSGFQLLESSWAIEPFLICPSGDLNLWVLDAADWSLRKIDSRRSQVLAEFSIQKEIPDPEIKTIREYLGFLFVQDAKGIYIFNGLGKHIRKLERKEGRLFHFLGEELYYLQGNQIQFFDLYTTEIRSLALAQLYQDAILTDERMLTLSGKQVDIFEFKP